MAVLLANSASRINTKSLGEAAQTYARIGIQVFPLDPGSKSPHRALGRGLDGRGGVWHAHSRPQDHLKWWSEYPDSNIGLRTGPPLASVLDVDVKGSRSGWMAIDALNRAGLVQGVFAQVLTPSGGGHLYFAHSPEGNHGSGGAGHGLDWRGVGGYVVAPPSKLEHGGYTWSWVRPERLGSTPEWTSILQTLEPSASRRERRTRNASKSLAGLVRTVSNADPGNRNAALYWAACRAVEEGLDTEPIVIAAMAAGLPNFEIQATIRSALGRI
jgi:hypothetical protein